MTKIIEIAHMLGEEIAKSEEMKTLEAAKAKAAALETRIAELKENL